MFRNIAKILEIKQGNPFRIRAYERAAQSIDGLTRDIDELVEQDRLTDIPGIGRDLSDKIEEFSRTGRVKAYEDLKKTIPEGLLDLCDIPSVGPKTARLLYERLKIKGVDGLEAAIAKGRLNNIPGIKEKTVENMKKGIEILRRGRERMTLAQATALAQEFLKVLKRQRAIKEACVAGSLRRQKETVRDIDILVTSTNPSQVMQDFISVPLVKDVLAHGETKSSVRTSDDVQVDCRVVEEKSFGAALLYFTGSKNFNIHMRQLAIKKGLKINEYGVFAIKKSAAAKEVKERFVCGRTEEEIFRKFGMTYIEPELREDTGEIELAREGRLPVLVEPGDIKGDFHVHSDWSDGNNTIAEMASAAKSLGYSYVVITDHSQSLKVAGGLTPAELKKKKREIDQVNSKLKGIRVLFGTEADIDSDGNIDYPDSILKGFDVVVAAIHSGFKQSRQQLTRRIVRACENPYVHIIAHPTGKLWGVREAYDIDFEEVIKACRRTNTHLEINAFPERLDLNSQACRFAKDSGLRLCLGSDSHEAGQLSVMRFGVAVARRGWLAKEDLLNTLPLDKMLKAIKKG